MKCDCVYVCVVCALQFGVLAQSYNSTRPGESHDCCFLLFRIWRLAFFSIIEHDLTLALIHLTTIYASYRSRLFQQNEFSISVWLWAREILAPFACCPSASTDAVCCVVDARFYVFAVLFIAREYFWFYWAYIVYVIADVTKFVCKCAPSRCILAISSAVIPMLFICKRNGWNIDCAYIAIHWKVCGKSLSRFNVKSIRFVCHL